MRKRINGRKIVASLLSVFMIVGMIPVNGGVFAEESGTATATDAQVVEETTEEEISDKSEVVNVEEITTETTEESTEEPEQSETEEELVEFFETATVNGTSITVKADAGVFPAGSTLEVTPISKYEASAKGVEGAIDAKRDNEKNVVDSMTFDITIYDADGNEIEPDNSKGEVKITFNNSKISNSNLSTDIYHIVDAGGTYLAKEMTEVSEFGNIATVKTDGFSYYTVEFTYGTLQYVLDGDSDVALADILTAVGLSGDVDAVEVSDNTLFDAVQENGEWVVKAITPFTSNEWMKVTIDDSVYEIVVTDDATYQINNTISNIVDLSITYNGNAVADASSGSLITLSINGVTSVGNSANWTSSDRYVEREVLIDGLAVWDSEKNAVELNSVGGSSLTWTFTMPESDVFITFPQLTNTETVTVPNGTAVFRSGLGNGGAYTFETTKTQGDPYGYLAYTDNSGYHQIADDDSSSDSTNFLLPSSGTVTINNNTYFHLGYTCYSADATGAFLANGTTGSVTIQFSLVNKNPQTISANDVDITLGTKDATVGASITTGDGTLSYSVRSGQDIIEVNRSTGAITPLKAGTATVDIVASETNDYRRTTKSITVTVKKADTIIDASDIEMFVDDQPKPLAPETTGDGEVSYSIKSGSDIISISAGGTVTPLKAGKAVVAITAAETDDYLEATKDITINVLRRPNTITVSDIDMYTSDSSMSIGAETTGDGEVSYSIKSGSDVISISTDGMVTPLKAGKAIITIVSAETDTYLKATKDITVNVLQKPGAIEFEAWSEDDDGFAIDKSNEEMIDTFITSDEKKKAENGYNVYLWMDKNNVDNSITDEEKAKIKAAAGDGFVIGRCYDILLYKYIESLTDEDDYDFIPIEETSNPIGMSFALPEKLTNVPEGVTREYKVVRVHNEKVEVIPSTYDAKTKTISFASDRFSYFAITYKDSASVADASVSKAVTSARTGDAVPVLLIVVVMITALFGIGVIVARRRLSKQDI